MKSIIAGAAVHDFLDKDYKIERSTFADGTTVTVDWNTQTVTVK